ncbi:MAG: type 1 glutamine amidotransferase [Candidatus Eremiobacteraeota bacterium]|nr:type 1 glutamine amidotransferase [Candidatus Eremiobacteraeota bacterium]MBV9646757.1 type 1 glutamine amidotransferase [Candidatus Eremiobacteraeota bacterium]
MEHNGKRKRVAILATDGVERLELTEPRKALENAGMRPEVISPKGGEIQSYDHEKPSERITVDRLLEGSSPNDYDALVLPGGVRNPDVMRTIPAAVQFVRAFFDAGKPIAAICHGPWMLIEADIVGGMKLTSWSSLKRDLENAGAHWSDQQVVEDRWLLTSRKPDDLPVFCERMVTLFGRQRAEQEARTEAVTV